MIIGKAIVKITFLRLQQFTPRYNNVQKNLTFSPKFTFSKSQFAFYTRLLSSLLFNDLFRNTLRYFFIVIKMH
jgi:hypothetical protein